MADNDSIQESTLSVFNPRAALGLVHLFDRPWWSRIWVVQEATVHINTILACGNRWVTLEELAAAASVMAQLDNLRCHGLLPEMPWIGSMTVWTFEDFRKRGAVELKLTQILERL